MRASGHTDRGKVRRENQDVFLIRPIGKTGVLLVLCDGVGGHKGGKVAATLAADVFSYTAVDRCRRLPEKAAQESVETALREAVMAANRKVYEGSLSDHVNAGMSCTLAAVLVFDRRAYRVHVGDSRIWLMHARRLRLLSKDHTVGETLGRRSHRLSRAIGGAATVEPDIAVFPFAAGDVCVLTSDGVHGNLASAEIAKLLRTQDAPDSAAKALVSLAVSEYGDDNATAVVLYYD